MNFNFKKIGILAVGIAFTGILSYATRSSHQEAAITPQLVERFNLTSFEQPNTAQDYVATLNQQENNIWKEIETLLAINKQECEALKQEQEWVKTYNDLIQEMLTQCKDAEKISSEHYQVINDVLQEFNINPETITIVAWNGASPAASIDAMLLINEKLVAPMPLKMKKFIIAHEISHIIHKDHSTSFILGNLQLIKNNDSQELNNVLNKLSQFVEVRADVSAALHSTEFAEGHILYAENELKLFGNKLYPDYPSNGERLELGKQILAMHTL